MLVQKGQLTQCTQQIWVVGTVTFSAKGQPMQWVRQWMQWMQWLKFYIVNFAQIRQTFFKHSLTFPFDIKSRPKKSVW